MNKSIFERGNDFSYCFDQEKEVSDTRENVDLAKDPKLTFLKALSRSLEKGKERSDFKSSEEIANDGKLTLEETKKSSGLRVSRDCGGPEANFSRSCWFTTSEYIVMQE